MGSAPTLHATHELYPNFKSQFLTHFQTPQKVLKNLTKNSYISAPLPNHHPHTPTKPLPHLTGSPTTAYLPLTLPTAHPTKNNRSTAFYGPGCLKRGTTKFSAPTNIWLERRLADSSNNHKNTTTNNDKNFRNQFE